MHHSNPWEELYKNWPARNDREAHALRLLSEAKSDKIMEEMGMSREELRDFMEWAREKLARYGHIENLEAYGVDGITIMQGIVPLENSAEGVALDDAFIFAVPYLYEPYILITGKSNPTKILMEFK